MPSSRRSLVLLAAPLAAGSVVLAGAADPIVSALALGGHAHAAASAKHCFTVRVKGHNVRECLIAGPRGPRGFSGPRGFTGPRGARGLKGSTGPAGRTGAAGPVGAAGSQGPAGTARAYAVVDPGLAPSVVTTQSSNVSGVRHIATGQYCVAVANGINPATETAAVSGEASHSSPTVIPVAALDAGGIGCNPTNEFKVDTYDAKSPGQSDSVAFTIVIP
jgi:hypothetical protein